MRFFHLAAFFLLLPLLSATCPFLDVSVVTQASVVQGARAVYPISLTNRGLEDKLVQLAGTCPDELGCVFSPVPHVILPPSETRLFTLSVATEDAAAGNYSIPLDLSLDGTVCQSLSLRLEVKPAVVTPKPPFEVRVSPDKNMSARPLETVTYTVTIKNNQPERGFARLSAKTPLVVDFSAIDVDLDPESEKTVTARVFVPAGTPRGTYGVLFVVNAFEGSGCCEHSFAFPRQLFVFSDKLSLALQNVPLTCLAVAHENQTQYTFQIRNNGEIKGPYRFSIESLASVEDFAKLDATLLEIKPGDVQPLTLTLKPSSKVILRTYPFRLKATYLDYTIFERPLCATVDATHYFRVFGPDSVQITRGEAKPIDFLIRNTGTVRETYSLSATVPEKFDVRLIEGSVTLSPGESKNVSVLVSTTLQTPLSSNHFVFLRVSDGRVQKVVNTTLSVVSSVKPGKSFLDIQAKPLDGYVGVTDKVLVRIKNSFTRTQHNVSLRVQGLPAGWATVLTAPRNILGGKTAPFDIQLTIPSTAKEAQYSFSYFAQSTEGEKTEAFNVLTVKKPPAHLNVKVANVLRRGDEVSFNVVVYNNGALPLSGVVVEAGDKTLTLDSIAPGEQRLLAFQALAVGPLTVKARSREGIASNTETLQPPLAEGGLNVLLLIIVLLILIILAIAFLLRAEQLQELSSKA